ncbi:MAG: hypothetical protein ACOY5F_12665 [Pseudomonadota bacterium]
MGQSDAAAGALMAQGVSNARPRTRTI